MGRRTTPLELGLTLTASHIRTQVGGIAGLAPWPWLGTHQGTRTTVHRVAGHRLGGTLGTGRVQGRGQGRVQSGTHPEHPWPPGMGRRERRQQTHHLYDRNNTHSMNLINYSVSQKWVPGGWEWGELTVEPWLPTSSHASVDSVGHVVHAYNTWAN
jgi:hypothetical protein